MRSPSLPVGFVVHSEYVIESLLGHGGFGFTYRAHHRSLDVPVALKEFFPLHLVTRRADQSSRASFTRQSGAIRICQDCCF
jgi:serine/threonine protein kinase